MILKIIKKNKESVEVQLIEKEAVVDMLIMPLDFNFDTVLVTSIDKLLKRNRITKVSSLDIVLEDFEDESSASSMVVRTVAEALKVK
ncbi:MAG: hypothetical protein AAB374_01320 [Patescibacteria group bacterium]